MLWHRSKADCISTVRFGSRVKTYKSPWTQAPATKSNLNVRPFISLNRKLLRASVEELFAFLIPVQRPSKTRLKISVLLQCLKRLLENGQGSIAARMLAIRPWTQRDVGWCPKVLPITMFCTSDQTIGIT